ncbi:hypothetical protein NRA10_16220 [Acinetobacter baumannii]|nr:hypothetical protein [Acinetobacter baumannii]MDC5098091.1 hypothetical protein [Acinetobacter baumannii]MDC5373970.1 hypothetical protein [Acinetobacter baumannii]MDC5579409.1 hypothetical protein [Acinetobacter baumannii]
MSYADRTPMAKFFDALAFESGRVKVTDKSDKNGANRSIHFQLSCGFAKFEKNGQHFEFTFNHQKQVIDQACFEAILEKLVIKH